MNTINLDEIFVKHADRTGVPWQLIKAVSQQESNLNPKAVKTMDKTGMQAIGLMQVTCPSIKIIEGWMGEEPAEGGCDSLFDPDKNVQMGTDILSWDMTFFGFLRGIACFNI
ncbi:MAG: transglycosylase SLT domain-containing protein [Gammaproteobacteria bacterium]